MHPIATFAVLRTWTCINLDMRYWEHTLAYTLHMIPAPMLSIDVEKDHQKISFICILPKWKNAFNLRLRLTRNAHGKQSCQDVGVARVILHSECMMHSCVLLFVFLPTAPAPSATPAKATTTASAPSSSPSKATPRSTTPEMLLLVSIRSCHRIRFCFHWHRRWAQSRLVSSRNVHHNNCSSDGKCGDLHRVIFWMYLCSSNQVALWRVEYDRCCLLLSACRRSQTSSYVTKCTSSRFEVIEVIGSQMSFWAK